MISVSQHIIYYLPEGKKRVKQRRNDMSVLMHTSIAIWKLTAEKVRTKSNWHNKLTISQL